jgi:hypothetical protein
VGALVGVAVLGLGALLLPWFGGRRAAAASAAPDRNF